MAIFHCAVSHGSRKDGQSGAAKVDYITRSGKYIGDAGEVIGAWAGHLPSWTGGNPRVLFAAADEYERANARLFTQVLFALPNELSDEDALLLAYHYAEAVTENGAPYVLAVHRGGAGVPDSKAAAAEPKEAADDQELPPHNRHAHLVICERIDDGLERTAREWFRRANKKEPALGGAAKDRTMNGGDWVPEARHLCADYINYGLERAGFSERVTCESHETRIARAEAAGDEETAEQLRLKPPGIHLGPTARAIETGRPGRSGRPSWRGTLHRAIQEEGAKLRVKVEDLNAKLSQLDVQEAAVTEKLEAARRVAAVQFEQREEALLGTSMGEALLRAERIEVAGETGATLSVVEHGQVVEIAQQRFGAALDLREAGFRKTSVGSRYLIEMAQSILGEAQSPTPPQRELIITTAESRLGRELDEQEATLRASAAGAEVLGGVQLERADEYGTVLTLVQREQLVDTAERRLRERRKAEQEEVRRALDRREETLRSMSTGAHHLAAAARELFGEGKQVRTLPDRDVMIGEAERRVEEELRGREEALRSFQPGAQYLSEAEQERFGEGKRASVLADRDVIVTEVEQRLGQELTTREEELVASAGGNELLVAAFSELCAGYPSFGDGSSLSERSQIIALAERWLEDDRAEDAARSAILDDLETMLKKTSSGAQHLAAAAQQEVLRARKELSPLDERESIVRIAVQEVEQELDRREEVLAGQPGGARVLREMKPEAGEDGAALSLVEHEKQLDGVKRRLEEEAEARRAAEERLSSKPGGGDLYRAVLTKLDPGWWDSGETAVENIDAALAAAASDSDRLERLRDVLADPVDVACYRAALAKGGDRFTVADLDAAIEAALRGHAKAAVRKREEEEKRERAAKGRVARLEALSDAGRELYTARLTALVPAVRRAGGPPGAVVDRALDETESDGLLQDLEAVFEDAENRSYYRGMLGAAGDQVTLEQIGAALKATEAFVRRKQTIFEYPGNNEHPAGSALYAAAREALAPDWRPGAELPAGLLDQVIGRVEDQLVDRVREAADIVEASVPTAQPWSHRPGYRVPAVSDQLLDQLVQDDDNAFFKAVVPELRKRYARRAHYDTPYAERYDGAARLASQQQHLVSTWSTVLARVLKGYLSRLREIVLAACDKILGGDLGERLARRRAQVERAADAADAGLPRTPPSSYEPQVPVVSDETLEQVVTDESTPFLKEVVAEVRDRYDHREHAAAYKERYDHEARRKSEGSHLNGVIENKHARAGRLWLHSNRSSPWPTRESVEASVVKDHRSTVLEVFEVACDEVVGRGELGAQLREHRAQVQQAAAAAEKALPTPRPERDRPKCQVPAVSDETLEHAAAGKSDPFLQEVVAEVLARYDLRAGFDVAREERYDHEARRNSEGSHLNGVIENKHARAGRLWLRSSRSSPRPTRESVEASVVKDHRSTVLEVFEVACDEVVGRGELGAQLREHRAQVQQAAAAAEKALPTPRPERDRPKCQVPAVSDETLEHAAAGKSDPFLQEVVAEVLARYDLRAGFDVAREERYDHEARRNSEGSHLNGVIENKHARAGRLWLRSSRSSPRPTRESVEASVVKDHRSTVLEVFEVACDEVVGRGELGAQLREHRAQVQQAAAAAEKALPTPRPERDRPKCQVPAVSDETLEHAAAGKSDPFLQEVVAEVLARYDLRAGFDVAREERYDHEARRNSEGSHLNGVIENKHARAGRLWLRSSRSSPRPTRESVEASVVKDHRSTVLEVFEVACDEVVGRGELGAQLREHRAQVQRVVDAVAPSLPATESHGRPGRHVPAVSDETLAEVRAGADAFLQKVVDLVGDRYDYKTPREERYDDADRRQSEDTCLAELIAKTLKGQRESRFSSTQQTAGRARALKDHRSRIRGIFMSARDDVLRGDELRDRQQERSVRPSGAQRAGGAGTSAGRRAATAPPSESPSTSPGHEREPHGRGQQRGKQQERAGQDSTTGHGSKGKQGERPRAAAAPAPAPAVVSVTEADRVRLAVHAVAAKLPRTQPYGNSSHRPPALSDERFNRMAAATDDEFVRKVIAAVQEKGNYYTDFERTESENAHLRPAVGRMYQDALDEYEKAKAKRRIFSKRPPTWTEAEAAVIKEFISEQLGVIKEICREVQQRTPAAVRSELQRFEPGQVVTPRPSKSRTRATNQQGRGDSGQSR